MLLAYKLRSCKWRFHFLPFSMGTLEEKSCYSITVSPIPKDERITDLQTWFPQPLERWLKMNTLPPKHSLTLQLLRCKPSLPQMLRVWSVLTENPSILLQHFMLDSQRTYPNLSVFWLFSRSFFPSSSSSSIEQVHFPLQGIWQMGDRDFSSSPGAAQKEHEPQSSWHSRTRLTSNSTVSSLKSVIQRQLGGK